MAKRIKLIKRRKCDIIIIIILTSYDYSDNYIARPNVRIMLRFDEVYEVQLI